MRECVIIQSAENEIASIIERKSLYLDRTAKKWNDGLFKKFDILAQYPNMGTPAEDGVGKKYPYDDVVIFYEFDDEYLYVNHVSYPK